MVTEEAFSAKVGIYVKYRPPYAKGMYDFLYENLIVNKNKVIADVGSGTGMFCGDLVKNGNIVYAIEPNEKMSEAAYQTYKDYANYKAIKGTAEDTLLSNDSVDVVTAAQSFHWFNMASFKLECQRILKEEGWVVLVWNFKIDTPLRAEVKLLRKKMASVSDEYHMDWEERIKGIKAFFNNSYEEKTFDNSYYLDCDSFLGQNLSSGFAPNEGTKEYNDFKKELIDIFNRYQKDSFVFMPCETRIYYGKVK